MIVNRTIFTSNNILEGLILKDEFHAMNMPAILKAINGFVSCFRVSDKKFGLTQ